MLRGFTHLRCPNCGRIFLAPDIEHGCMVYLHPILCPRCGTKCSPLGRNAEYRRLGIITEEEDEK